MTSNAQSDNQSGFNRAIPLVFIGTLAFHILAIIISYSLYPRAYSLLTNTISDLGSIEGNPRATILFGIGHVLSGVMLVPLLVRLSHQIPKGNGIAWRSARFWGLILNGLGGLGFIFVGAFPLEFDTMHGIGAGCIFVGFIIGAFLLGRALTQDAAKDLPPIAHRLGLVGMRLFLVFLAIGVFTGIVLIWPGPVTFSLAEWLSFFLFLAWLFLLAGVSRKISILEGV